MMASLFSLREAVFKALEMKRESKEIGKSLQAHVLLHLEDDMAKTVSKVCPDSLAQWLIVSKVTLVEETLPVILDFEIDVEEALGDTCPRCWNIVDHVDENGLCDRCHQVMTQA